MAVWQAKARHHEPRAQPDASPRPASGSARAVGGSWPRRGLHLASEALARRRAASRLGLRAGGEALVVAYLAAVAVVGALPALVGIPHQAIVSATAFSPAALVAGRWWLLPLSGIVVDGDTPSQLAMLAQVIAATIVLADARAFWRAAITAHVGATLLAYATIAALLLAAPDRVEDLLSAPDYGVSCIWAGAVGALALTGARCCADRRGGGLLLAIAAGSLFVLLPPRLTTTSGSLDLASVEHLLAFALGALTAVWTRPSPAPLALGSVAPGTS